MLCIIHRFCSLSAWAQLLGFSVPVSYRCLARFTRLEAGEDCRAILENADLLRTTRSPQIRSQRIARMQELLEHLQALEPYCGGAVRSRIRTARCLAEEAVSCCPAEPTAEDRGHQRIVRSLWELSHAEPADPASPEHADWDEVYSRLERQLAALEEPEPTPELLPTPYRMFRGVAI